MTETLTEEQTSDAARESAGMKLARARESQNLSVVEVARSLRLSVKQVEALEADQLDRLPGRTFVRGFVRNYARLINLDPDQLVAEYLPPQPEVEMQHIQAPSQQISFSEHHSKPWLKWLASGVVVVILASWGGLAWIGPETYKPVVVHKSVVPATSSPVMEPAVTPLDLSASRAPAEVVPTEETAVQASAPVEQPLPPQAPATGAESAALARVTLGFSGMSWVEARDKKGNKIFSQNNPPGTQQTLEGEPPISLVIGSAPNVKLTYKGQPVDLAAHTKADVARLTLE